MNVSEFNCRKKYVEMPDADQTLSNKEKICSDIRPGEAAAAISKMYIFYQGTRMPLRHQYHI